jgi:hemin uptake protein HemP
MITEQTNHNPPLIDPSPADAPCEAKSRDAWRSEELLGERTEVQILHNNEVYRLRRTRQGKLILYK